MIKSVTISNMYSFGAVNEPIMLNSGLNIIIGANNTGKTNFLKVIDIIHFLNNYIAEGNLQYAQSLVNDFINIDAEAGVSPLIQYVLSDTSHFKDTVFDFKLDYSFTKKQYYWDFVNGNEVKNKKYIAKEGYIEFFDSDLLSLNSNIIKLIKYPDIKNVILSNLQLMDRDIIDFYVGREYDLCFIMKYLSNPVKKNQISINVLKYLNLLCLLLIPDNHKLICFELGDFQFHPDVIDSFYEVLVEVAKKHQIIMTTNSISLIDVVSLTHESVYVFDRIDGYTQTNQLDRNELKVWLDNYSLGHLWARGDIGGNVY